MLSVVKKPGILIVTCYNVAVLIGKIINESYSVLSNELLNFCIIYTDWFARVTPDNMSIDIINMAAIK